MSAVSGSAAAAGAGAGAGASPAPAAAAAGSGAPLAATSTVSSALAVGLSARDTRDLATALGNPAASAATSMIVDVVDVRVADLDPDLLEPLNQKARLTDTLTTLHGSDPKFALFVIEEYEKLQHALKISHDSVIKWLNTLKALTKSIRANSQRLSASIGLHDAELKKREDIKRKIEENKRRKGVFEADISRYRLMVKELKAEIDGLKAAEKDSTDETVRKKYDEIHKLEDEHTKLTKERDAAANQRMALNKANVDAYNRWVELEAKRTAGEDEIKALDSQIKFQRAKSSAEEKNRAEWDGKRKQALDRKTFLERTQQTKLESLNKLKRDLAEATLRQSKFAAEADAEQTRRDELKAERALKQGQCKIAERKNVAKKSEIAAKAAELEKQAAATMKEKQNAEKELMKLNLMIQAKTEILARERADKALKKSIEDELQAVKYGLHMISDTEYEALKAGHADLIIEWKKEKFHGKKGIEDLKDDLKAKEKVVESFVRERDVLNQKIMAKVADIREKDALLKIMKSLLKNVKNEHDAYTVSLRQLAKQNERDELELKKHDANLVKRQLQKARARDEVAERDLKIEQFRAQISANAAALKTHTNLLDAAQSQYNVYRKKSVEQKTEQHEQERVLKALNKSIERLRKEIADGDKEFASKQIDWVKVRGETEDVRHLNSEAAERVSRATDTLNSQAVKVRTLSQFIADADEEIRLQRKQYHTVVDEQRTLNQQLIQRNEQLAKLYEQLKLQYSFKEKNKTFYGDHLALLSGLRASKEQLSAQFDELNQRCHIYDELKLTIDGVTRELTGEQLRVRALQDELHKLINVHRWRKLADTNTDAYDMVQRVHALTKQIIDKTSAVQARDAAIAEREKMYVNLRKVVSRQPGAEAMEQLRMYATTLREKKAKLKSIRAELAMFQRRVLEYKEDLSRIDADLKLVKVAYFQLRQEQARSGGALSARSALGSGRPDSQGGTGGPLPPLGATGGGVGGGGGYDNAIEELKRQQSEQAAAHEQLLAGLQTSSSGAATSAAAGAAALASLASLVHAPPGTVAAAADDLGKPGTAPGAAGGTAASGTGAGGDLPPITPSKGEALRKGLGTPRTAAAAAASGARPPAATDAGFAI